MKAYSPVSTTPANFLTIITTMMTIIAGVVYTGKKQLISGVNTKVVNISANFHKNLKWSQWDTQGPGRN
jgi:hypothetical protein